MIQLVAKVLNADLPTKPKFVLVCLADSADEYGICYPGVATLSRMTSMPERTLQRMLGYLKTHEWIETFWEPTDKVRYKKILHYRLKLEGLKKRPQPDYGNCPKELREEVVEKFKQICSYCHKPGNEKTGPDGKAWEIDRVIPGSIGGQYIAQNVTLSCRTCNRWKRARMAPQNVKTLGAIFDETGCHSEQEGVPLVAHNPKENLQENLSSLTVKKEGEEFPQAFPKPKKKEKTKTWPQRQRFVRSERSEPVNDAQRPDGRREYESAAERRDRKNKEVIARSQAKFLAGEL